MAKKTVKTTVTTVEEKSAKKKRKRKKVAKKNTVKKAAPTKTITRTVVRSDSGSRKILEMAQKTMDRFEKRDSLLVENFVGLQKAMATLSVRFSEMSQNINTMLKIFEEAARTLADSEKQVDKTLTTKLDSLIEQNKNISREISLVDSKMRRTGSTKSTAPAMYSRQMASPAQQPVQSIQSAGLPPKQLPSP